MIPPSPDLQRKFRNTDQIVKSNMSHTIPNLVASYPNDYIDLVTYESMKRAMQFI